MSAKKLPLYILGTLSLTLAATGCASGPSTTADCVKKGTTEVVRDQECDTHHGGFIWVYNGRIYSGPGGRTYVRGHSYTVPQGNVKTRTGTTLRGGFGAKGFSGGS